MLGVQLLLHLPSPQRLASDQPTSEYSLAALDINQRHLWLNTTILILYKVSALFTSSMPAILQKTSFVMLKMVWRNGIKWEGKGEENIKKNESIKYEMTA